MLDYQLGAAITIGFLVAPRHVCTVGTAFYRYPQPANQVYYPTAVYSDDAVETMLLNMIHQGQMKAMPARYYSEERAMHVIRPLMYVTEWWALGYGQGVNPDLDHFGYIGYGPRSRPQLRPHPRPTIGTALKVIFWSMPRSSSFQFYHAIFAEGDDSVLCLRERSTICRLHATDHSSSYCCCNPL